MSPVFNYERYSNPYVQSISSLLEQPGQIEAQRAQTIGTAQANAALQGGQAWGNAIQGAGQAIGQIPQQIEAQKLKAAQLADIQGQIAERNATAKEKQQHLAAMAAGEAAIKSAVDPVTGKIDYDKAVESWTKAGFPTQANAYRESLQKTDQTAQQLQEGQQKIQAGQRQVQQAAANHLGELGAAGLQKIQSGASPLEVRDYTMGLVANAVSHGLIQPDAAKQMLIQSAQASPDQLAGIYQKLLDGAPDVKSRLVAEDLKKAETAKNLAEAQKAANPPAKEPKQYEVTVPSATGPMKKLFTEDQLRSGVPEYQKPPESASPNALNDVKESIRGMKEGTLPPMMPGRATKEYLATMAEAHRQGYNLQEAVTDWNATQKHISTMNGAQQLRLNQAINALPEMLDKVDALAAQWKGGQFPLLNKANLAAATNGVYGEKVASVARQLSAQIADVTADLGNVYMGGNSPTDHALGLAAKSLSADWSEKVLKDMTALARNNVQIRSNSIRNTGVAGASATNPYTPPIQAPAANAKDPLGIR